MNIIGVIPARLKSTRLPGKLLIKVKGKTIIERVYENAKKAALLKAVYIATDSKEIREVMEKAGAKVIMTPASCKSGSERIREAVKELKLSLNDVVVNIQGDEPMLEPRLIDKLVAELKKDKNCDSATLASPITDKKEISDPSCVKVVLKRDSTAMYFSRAAIPFDRDGSAHKGSVLKHVGVYAYKKSVLDRWAKLESRYEKIEKLEQLRLLENGCVMKVVVSATKSIGIDTPADLKRFKKAVK